MLSVVERVPRLPKVSEWLGHRRVRYHSRPVESSPFINQINTKDIYKKNASALSEISLLGASA